MLIASETKKGMFIRHDNKICRIVEHEHHIGGGRAGGTVRLKLKDMATGHVTEEKLDPHAKLEDLNIERHKMKYLYEDGSGLCFMDPETFEQVSLPKAAIGHLSKFLKEETEVDVEFFEGNPIHVIPPEKITLAVSSTGAATKGATDSTFKPATLENGVELLVPHFIKNGDRIIIEVESGKYLDRAKE